jgi:hypothetical protein
MRTTSVFAPPLDYGAVRVGTQVSLATWRGPPVLLVTIAGAKAIVILAQMHLDKSITYSSCSDIDPGTCKGTVTTSAPLKLDMRFANDKTTVTADCSVVATLPGVKLFPRGRSAARSGRVERARARRHLRRHPRRLRVTPAEHRKNCKADMLDSERFS